MLIRRGHLTVWFTDEAVAAWHAPATGERGGQREHAKSWGTSRSRRSSLIIVGGPEALITVAEGVLESLIQHSGTNVEEGLYGRPVPTHSLFLVHALGHDLVNRTLDERSRDRLTPSTPRGIVYQHVLIPLEVAEKFADVSLKTLDAGYLAQRLALRPAV
jgi:hypothetical protein